MDATSRTGIGRGTMYATAIIAAMCTFAVFHTVTHIGSIDANPPAGTKFKVGDIEYSVIGTNTGSKEVMVRSAPNIESVVLPKTVMYNSDGEQPIAYTVTSIKNDSFQRRQNIKEVVIPSTVNFIGTGAFSGSKNIGSVTVDPGNVKFVSENGVLFNAEKTNLIYYPPGKTDLSYTIPEGVNIISSGAFKDAVSLIDVDIAETVRLMGSGAFQGCTSLSSVVLPASVTSIGESTFQGCTGLRTATVSPSMLQINTNAFRGCTSLVSIMIPDGISSIGTYAFLGCTSLRYVDLPASLSYLGANAFKGCTGLMFIEVEGSNQKFDDINGVLFTKDHSKLVFYPEGRCDAHYDVPGSATAINKEALMDKDVEIVTIHDGVVDIAQNAVHANALKIHYAGAPSLSASAVEGGVSISVPDQNVLSMDIGTFSGGNDITCAVTDMGWTFTPPEGAAEVYVQTVIEREPEGETQPPGGSAYLYGVGIGIAALIGICAVIMYLRKV